ncbi:MAG: tetratricopeptide (TPR) repeat protein [Myxococcota bacterium]|jgi:tetratricopeptide (TPR) repeat protein
MDERLEAGRLHLSNGEQAVRQGYPVDARMYFEAALLQFRGPELRLGEAHAMRGLAQVATVNGDPGEAERYARGAVNGYRELFQQLEKIDKSGISEGMKKQARMGEAASLVLLGEVLVRRGARADARTALSHARVLGSKLGHFDAVAGVWNMLARLAMREGRYEEARDSMDRALATYRENRSVDGEVGTLLLIAELERLRGNLEAAQTALAVAEPKAAESKNPMYEGRVLAASAALALQSQDLDSAESYYDLALPFARATGDQEMEGYCLLGLGEVASRLGRNDAMDLLIEGASALAELDHRHGLGGAMLRISEHALKSGDASLALAAAECARRCFRKTDPVRGVGQSGRLLVKSLAALEAWRAVLMVSAWRVDLVGQRQPTAVGVLDFYRQRAPASWWEHIQSLSGEQRARAAVQDITRILATVLDQIGASPDVWENSQGGVGAISALVKLGDAHPVSDAVLDDTAVLSLGFAEDDSEPNSDAEQAVLVLEDHEEGSMVWQRPPSEFDKPRMPSSAEQGLPTIPPLLGPYADLDRFLIETPLQPTLTASDDLLLVVEDDESGQTS